MRLLEMVTTFVFVLVLHPPSLKNVESLNFNITNFDDPESAKNMAYVGDGKASNGSVELNIVDYLFRVGRALSAKPLHLWDQSSGVVTDFTTRFTFSIDRATNGTYADGFAFYMAPHGYPIPPNSGGGTFALFNTTSNTFIRQNHVLAVEFDTFNGTIDPPMQHVGIDDNSLKSVAFAKFDIDKNLGKKCNVLIAYSASNKTLFVAWSFNETATSHSNSSLSYKIDLMEILPEWVDVGFSAATGELRERNVIHSWEFSSTLNSDATDNSSGEGYRGNGKGNVLMVAVLTSLTVLVVVVGSVAVWAMMTKKRRDKVDKSNDGEVGANSVKFDLDRSTIPRRFDYKELLAATNGFADDRKLGRGGSGQVYKGVLSNLGRVVAVKRIFANFANSERVFINEVRVISRLIHKNLVQFVGWCHEQGEFLLLFEYMPNGSLDTHLFGDKKPLTWDVRYKVALGVAAAVRYLHEDAEQCVLHRDIKSANVLLDTDFSTKLGDFGMAKFVDPRLRTERTGVVGTYGYLAPEYMNGGRASKESDIYSFGVVALEIACGRRTYRDGEFHVPLMNWVWQRYVEGNVMDVVDERLKKDFNVDEMRSLIIVGLWCTNPNDKERPKAAQVIKVLELEAPLPELPLDLHDRPPASLVTYSQQPNSQSMQTLPFTDSFISIGR
ncbi:L-type lectin-domain containing receptor kinase IX.1-like [Vigna unguiculata]|uniref:L-type lectin-domain containing receptor kinase IX.1-like n=1 Tax=Vigna unguiculata TaxID=3917 RepID=UPI001015DD1C|nr:L-type lectin-domain containing receptor kinase IX.1-like [Vigna unguiculata]